MNSSQEVIITSKPKVFPYWWFHCRPHLFQFNLTIIYGSSIKTKAKQVKWLGQDRIISYTIEKIITNQPTRTNVAIFHGTQIEVILRAVWIHANEIQLQSLASMCSMSSKPWAWAQNTRLLSVQIPYKWKVERKQSMVTVRIKNFKRSWGSKTIGQKWVKRRF